MSDSPSGSRTWWSTPRWLALALSVAVGAVAWLPSLLASHPFSAQLSVLTLTLVGLIWYTSFTYEGVQAAKDSVEAARQSAQAARESIQTARALALEDVERQRAGLATGLLAEVKWLDLILRQIVHTHNATRIDHLGHPVLEGSLARLELFKPRIADLLVQFVASVRTVRQGILRAGESTNGLDRSSLAMRAASEARFAVGIVVQLAPALVAEGGRMPEIRESPQGTFGDTSPPPKVRSGRSILTKGGCSVGVEADYDERLCEAARVTGSMSVLPAVSCSYPLAHPPVRPWGTAIIDPWPFGPWIRSSGARLGTAPRPQPPDQEEGDPPDCTDQPGTFSEPSADVPIRKGGSAEG